MDPDRVDQPIPRYLCDDLFLLSNYEIRASKLVLVADSPESLTQLFSYAQAILYSDAENYILTIDLVGFFNPNQNLISEQI